MRCELRLHAPVTRTLVSRCCVLQVQRILSSRSLTGSQGASNHSQSRHLSPKCSDLLQLEQVKVVQAKLSAQGEARLVAAKKRRDLDKQGSPCRESTAVRTPTAGTRRQCTRAAFAHPACHVLPNPQHNTRPTEAQGRMSRARFPGQWPRRCGGTEGNNPVLRSCWRHVREQASSMA